MQRLTDIAWAAWAWIAIVGFALVMVAATVVMVLGITGVIHSSDGPPNPPSIISSDVDSPASR